jgi:hypothetical protein
MKTLTMTLAAVTMLAGATAALAATETKAKMASVKSPESIECSKQADAKGLHGQERKKFRAECKKELKAKMSTTTSAAPTSTETKTGKPTTTKTN